DDRNTQRVVCVIEFQLERFGLASFFESHRGHGAVAIAEESLNAIETGRKTLELEAAVRPRDSRRARNELAQTRARDGLMVFIDDLPAYATFAQRHGVEERFRVGHFDGARWCRRSVFGDPCHVPVAWEKIV